MTGMSDEKNQAPKDDDHDLSVEKEVAPEEDNDWMPQPEPTDGPAPAP